MAAALIAAEPSVVRIHCRGVRDGRRCNHVLAVIEPDGRVLVRHDGREHDVTGGSTTCPRCKTRRAFGAD